jgi:Putative phospholipid-binding domain.
MNERDERTLQPLYSEVGGDLPDTPSSGETDDPLVASEEGIPYVPPSDRVMSDPRLGQGGPDVAGTDPTDAGELEREDDIQLDVSDTEPSDAEMPLDEEGEPAGVVELQRELPSGDQLRADVVAALRDSDVASGEHLQVSTLGSTATLHGEVESIDVLEELLGIVGDVPGVEEVVDKVRRPRGRPLPARR